MKQSEVPTGNKSGFAKWMIILAWLSGIFVLSLVFDEQLAHQFNPNQNPESRILADNIEVVLKRNRKGHYVTSGEINGKPVTFLVDTGATDVSVPIELARELGLESGRPLRSLTANGTITVYDTNINSLSIGEINLRNIEGNLNPGMGGTQILLGMSVLKKLEFTQRGDTLILRTL